MGLYDDILFPVELLKAQTDSRIIKYASLLKYEVVNLQTKDLDCSMVQYPIKKVGDKYVLHKDVVETEIVDTTEGPFGFYFKEVSRNTTPELITTTITACDFFNSDILDIWVEFKITFVGGVVTSISIDQYEERDPTPRLKQEKEIFDKLQESRIYYKSMKGKLAVILRKFLLKVHRGIQNINNKIQKLAFKL